MIELENWHSKFTIVDVWIAAKFIQDIRNVACDTSLNQNHLITESV